MRGPGVLSPRISSPRTWGSRVWIALVLLALAALWIEPSAPAGQGWPRLRVREVDEVRGTLARAAASAQRLWSPSRGGASAPTAGPEVASPPQEELNWKERRELDRLIEESTRD